MVTLLLNLAVAGFFMFRRSLPLLTAVALFAAVNVAGWMLKQRPDPGDKELRVLIVQANIGNAIKAEQEKGAYFHDYILRKYLEITDRGLRAHPDTDLIIWPETAFPARVTKERPRDAFQNKLRYSINTLPFPTHGAYEEGEGEIFNSLVLLTNKAYLWIATARHFFAFGGFS